ncbi:DUF3810 domain-containing protein [Saccharicrinis fermentans]|uniref:DUF3810 domain-containing protein n=1 Tax=Saccharicrinis fermentans DSM 9555 = JCM 21142 TaxID=869213 RepID=W7YD49_9BACT|nr:DUF3810 domain-containing protein [Saccharicrinis fermentans]GAF02396.1 hypothetical protein JCM21142_31030 [Saccharicrinis fermentans DSM 9555 = JCM 21142]
MQVKPSYIKKTIAFILLAVTVLLQVFFKNNAAYTEEVYSHGIYPSIAYVLSSVSAWVPFSLDDVFYVTLVLFLLIGLCMVVFRKLKLWKYLLFVFQTGAMIYVLFYCLWGFNYYREPAHQRFQLSQSVANDSVFISVFKQVIDHTNKSYTSTAFFERETGNIALEKSYRQMAAYLHLPRRMPRWSAKYVTFSDFFAKATILGYFGPFFNEIHINRYLTAWDIPVVTAHERSHQLGVTSEAEASFYGWIICVNSDEPFVQYSGWLYALDYFLYQSKHLETRAELIKQIRPEVVEDIKSQHKHWRHWRNAEIDKAASKVNDAYLKSNNIKEGIDDYNGVVQLIIDYTLQKTLIYGAD